MNCRNLKKNVNALPGNTAHSSEDLKEFRKVVSVIPLGNSKHFTVMERNDVLCIVKARLFCRYLKGSSLRVVYSYSERAQRIEFIEIYYKGDKENEDRKRIQQYLK